MSHTNSYLYLFFCIQFIGISVHADNKPNVIIILADDLGWGDVRCNNPKSIFRTPNIDGLAKDGMRFTNAHAPHSVCTPTRYALLTGRYCWRTFLKEGVLPGFSKALIPPTRLTLAYLFQQSGYRTGGFGKWHLGLNWTPVHGDPGDFHFGSQIHGDSTQISKICRRVNYKAKFKNGPLDLGFNTYFGSPSNCSRIPVFIEGDSIYNLDQVTTNEHGLIFDPELKRDTVDDRYIDKAAKFISASLDEEKPFFIYLALNAAHGAVSVPPEFKGKSGASSRADKCLWVDRSVSRMVELLRKNNVYDNTLVVFTADNGAKHIPDDRKNGHHSSGPFRGFKTDIWEGGHKVPFIISWPKKIPQNVINNNLLCLTDLFASFASLLGHSLPKWSGEDSIDQLSGFYNQQLPPIRKKMITQSYTGILAYQKDDWKLILDTKGSGGFYRYSPEVQVGQGMAPWRHDLSTIGQLYNLKTDPYETTDLFSKHPERVQNMKQELKLMVNEGRTR